MGIYEKLSSIQVNLIAPKNRYNGYGKYNYRSCEDILESLKPLLEKEKVALLIKDELVNIGNRFYVKAIIKLIDLENGESVEGQAFAREEESKKGMDASQISGTASTYARKYALNGMFCIDDNKDQDSPESKDEANKRAAETADQIKKQTEELYSLANSVGIKKDQVLALIQKKYKKKSVEELASEEYAFVINRIKTNAEKEVDKAESA